MPHVKLDRLDFKILAVLQADGRISNRDLADKVGLTPSPCLVRVKRLEKAGLIMRYMAQVELRKIADIIVVMSLIYVRDSDYKHSKLLETFIIGLPETCEFYDVNGECDYVARFVCRSIEDYSSIARRLLEDPLLRVRQISSYIVLRELKTTSSYDIDYFSAKPAS